MPQPPVLTNIVKKGTPPKTIEQKKNMDAVNDTHVNNKPNPVDIDMLEKIIDQQLAKVKKELLAELSQLFKHNKT